ncbi:DUF481 domain-containing protein [bacterium]|nr:DUF481 domain-containing protein [bacterium]
MKTIQMFVLFMFCVFLNGHTEEAEWKGDVGLSYVATSGNTGIQTFSSNVSTEGGIRTIRCQIKGNYLITKDSRIEKANRLHINARFEKIITAGLFGFLESSYARDKYSGYTYRASLGPGVGYDIIQSDYHQLKGLISSLYYFDKYSVGDVTRDRYSTAKSELSYQWKMRENVTFEGSGNCLVNLENHRKYFLHTETALNVSINNRLAVGISYQVNYQNKPPSNEVRKTDTTFMTSLIIRF